MRTNPTTTVRAAAVVLLATLIAPAATATAQDAGPPRPSDADEASATDARLLAAGKGWKLEPTVEYVAGARDFAGLATALATDYPKSYAGASYGERPGDAAVVRFVDDPPAGAVDLVRRSGLEVEVVGGARYTETALQERAEAVHGTLLESGFEQVVTAAMPGDVVLATVFGKGDAKLPDELADGVEVEVAREPIATDEHSRGGARLLDDGVFECTSGFAVETPAGTTGIATAGHCTGLNQYQQPTDGLVYSMTHQAEHYGFWGDYEWKTTPHIEPAEFYATATEQRDVNSVSGQLPVNTPSCVYGRSSNARACDQVYSNFVIATFSGPTHFFLMAMDDDNTIGGDSGGGWSFATIADGIHKGDLTLGGGVRNVWSRADLLPVALGVSVRTK